MKLNYSSSIDTNAICRFILGDIPNQQEKVRALLSDYSQTFFVSDTVLAESVFVMERNYSCLRQDIAKNLLIFLSFENVEHECNFIEDILKFYASHPSLSFVDCYAACLAEVKGKEPFWTFDKKLASQHPSAKLIK